MWAAPAWEVCPHRRLAAAPQTRPGGVTGRGSWLSARCARPLLRCGLGGPGAALPSGTRVLVGKRTTHLARGVALAEEAEPGRAGRGRAPACPPRWPGPGETGSPFRNKAGPRSLGPCPAEGPGRGLREGRVHGGWTLGLGRFPQQRCRRGSWVRARWQEGAGARGRGKWPVALSLRADGGPQRWCWARAQEGGTWVWKCGVPEPTRQGHGPRVEVRVRPYHAGKRLPVRLRLAPALPRAVRRRKDPGREGGQGGGRPLGGGEGLPARGRQWPGCRAEPVG